MSEAFVRFFVEIVGHYSLFMGGNERDEESSASSSSPTPLSFQREAFRKAVSSKSLRRFLEVFMETQMFAAFIQEREMRRQGLRGTCRCSSCSFTACCCVRNIHNLMLSHWTGLFEVRAQDYLDSLPGAENRGVNKFLKGLGRCLKKKKTSTTRFFPTDYS